MSHAEPKRDRYGRPLIQIDGDVVPYSRVTTIAKALEDEGGLARWKMRQVVSGMAHRPDLVKLASTTDEKGMLDRIAEDALAAVGTDAAANTGTALHALVEKVGLGMPIKVHEDMRADLEAFEQAVSGITITHRELFVVHDDHQYAGTLDMIVEHPAYAYPLVADLKTGRDLSWSWRSIAVQLAGYANAQHAYDVVTNERRPMPELDTSIGLVLHLPAGQGEATWYEVDIVAGRYALEQSLWVRKWRKQSVATKLHSFGATPVRMGTTPLVAEIDVAQQVAEAFGGEVLSAEGARLEWIKARAVKLVEQGHGPLLVAAWPEGLPTLKEGGHTPHQLDEVVAIIDRVEDKVLAPFPEDEDPGEGQKVGSADVEAVRKGIAALDDDQKAVIGSIIAETPSLSLKVIPHLKNVTILSMLIAVGKDGALTDEEWMAAFKSHLNGGALSDEPFGLVARRCPLSELIDTASILIPRTTNNVTFVAADAGGWKLWSSR